MAGRAAIVSQLRSRARLGDFERMLRESADATDAVLSAFAPWPCSGLAKAPEANHEGWIAVHQ